MKKELVQDTVEVLHELLIKYQKNYSKEDIIKISRLLEKIKSDTFLKNPKRGVIKTLLSSIIGINIDEIFRDS